MRDITLGQYFPTDSVIHRLDPRVKLILMIVYLVFTFITFNFFALGLIALSIISIVLISKVPLKMYLKILLIQK